MTSVTAGSFALSTGCLDDILREPVFNKLQFYFKKKLNVLINLFIFGCTVLLHVGFLWLCPAGTALFAVHRLPIAVASCCRTRALGLQWLWCLGSVAVARGLSGIEGMWNLPRPGFKPMSPALAGGSLTTGPPGKSTILLSV